MAIKKFGLQKTMMNAKGFFFFKFEDFKGVVEVIQGGPWIIRRKPLVLNFRSSSTDLK